MPARTFERQPNAVSREYFDWQGSEPSAAMRKKAALEGAGWGALLGLLGGLALAEVIRQDDEEVGAPPRPSKEYVALIGGFTVGFAAIGAIAGAVTGRSDPTRYYSNIVDSSRNFEIDKVSCDSYATQQRMASYPLVTIQNMNWANFVWQTAFDRCLSALGWREVKQ